MDKHKNTQDSEKKDILIIIKKSTSPQLTFLKEILIYLRSEKYILFYLYLYAEHCLLRNFDLNSYLQFQSWYR